MAIYWTRINHQVIIKKCNRPINYAVVVRQPKTETYSLDVDKDGKGHWVEFFWCNNQETAFKKTAEARKLFHEAQIMNVSRGTIKELKYKIWQEEQYRRQSNNIIMEDIRDYENSLAVLNHPFFCKGAQNSLISEAV